jgi:predicted PurR-regulated permease PerM
MNANVLVAKKWHLSFFSERKAARENFRLSFTQAYILAILLIACLGIYYIWILNQNATKWYQIRKLQGQYRELTFQENLLDIRIAEGKSIDVIASSPIMQHMEEVTTPTFIVTRDALGVLKN